MFSFTDATAMELNGGRTTLLLNICYHNNGSRINRGNGLEINEATLIEAGGGKDGGIFYQKNVDDIILMDASQKLLQCLQPYYSDSTSSTSLSSASNHNHNGDLRSKRLHKRQSSRRARKSLEIEERLLIENGPQLLENELPPPCLCADLIATASAAVGGQVIGLDLGRGQEAESR